MLSSTVNVDAASIHVYTCGGEQTVMRVNIVNLQFPLAFSLT